MLEKSDYDLEEKDKQVMLSEKGIDKIENLSKTYGILKNDNFYHSDNLSLQHHIQQALKANLLFFKDKDYIVKDNKVELIDEQTGRILLGRRLSDGLHSAIEAKEHVDIQHESQTIASITYQNYFRMYSRSSAAQTQWKSGLAGMTGTAQTQAEEFFEIYGLKVVSIPTNKKMIRKDWNDQIYRTEVEKNKAIVEGVNMISKHEKPSAANPQGGIVKKEAPIHISNLSLLTKDGETTRVGFKMEGDKKVRFSKKSNEVI